MTHEEAKSVINESLVTLLGKLPHGYVIYASTAEAIIDKIFDEMPKPVHEFKAEPGLAFDDDITYCAEELGVGSSGYIEAEVDTFKRGKKYIVKVYEVEDSE